MVIAAFVGQVQGDSQRKLQRWEGLAGLNNTQLLEVAKKSICELGTGPQTGGRQENETKGSYPQVWIEPDRNKPEPCTPLQKNELAYDKETGHWKMNAPVKRGETRVENSVALRIRLCSPPY